MRALLGFALLAVGIIAAVQSIATASSWTAPFVLAGGAADESLTTRPEPSRLQNFSGLAEQDPAQAVPAVPQFETTVAVAQPAPASTSDEPVAAPPLASSISGAPSDPATRAALARDIQVEMARLGCYAGPIDGRWSPATQRGAGLLVSEANAVIPVTEPDFALLSLARSATAEQACGPAIAAATERPQPAMGLGGPDTGTTAKRAPVYHRDRNVEQLFTNPLGR